MDRDLPAIRDVLATPEKIVYTGTQLFLNRLARVPVMLSKVAKAYLTDKPYYTHDERLKRNWQEAVLQAENAREPLFLDLLGMFSNSETKGEFTRSQTTIPREFGAALIVASMNLHELFQDGKRDFDNMQYNIKTNQGIPELDPERWTGQPKSINHEWIKWAQRKDKQQQERKFTVEVEGEWKDDVRTLIITNNELGIRVEIHLDNSWREHRDRRAVKNFALILGGSIRFAPGVKVTSEMVSNAFTAPYNESKSKQDEKEQKREYTKQHRTSGSESKTEANSGPKTEAKSEQKTNAGISFVGMPKETLKAYILKGFAKLETAIAKDYREKDAALDLQIFGATSITQHDEKSLREAYRALAFKYHTDIHPELSEVFIQRISVAYRNLAKLV